MTKILKLVFGAILAAFLLAAPAQAEKLTTDYQVIPIWFLPQGETNSPHLKGIAARSLQEAQGLYQDQMNNRTFKFERDQWSNVKFIEINANHPASWYIGTDNSETASRIMAELSQKGYPLEQGKIYCVFGQGLQYLAINYLPIGGRGYQTWFQQTLPPQYGAVLIGSSWLFANEGNSVVAHELGHGFGLPHNYHYQGVMHVYGFLYWPFTDMKLLNNTDFAEKYLLCRSPFFYPQVDPATCVFPANPPALPPSGLRVNWADLSMLAENLLFIEGSNFGISNTTIPFSVFIGNRWFDQKVLSWNNNSALVSLAPTGGFEINEGTQNQGACLFNKATGEGGCQPVTVWSFYKAKINSSTSLQVGDILDLGFEIYGNGEEWIPCGSNMPWNSAGFHYRQSEDYSQYFPGGESGGEDKSWLGVNLRRPNEDPNLHPPYLFAFNPGQEFINGKVWAGGLIKLEEPGDYFVDVALVHGDLSRRIISSYLDQSLFIQVAPAPPPTGGPTPTLMLPLPTTTPTPTPTVYPPTGGPSPEPATTIYKCGVEGKPKCFEWVTYFYDNPNLAGDPLVVANTADGTSGFGLVWENSFYRYVGPDYFSIRWERKIDFKGGNYLFWARYDDGVRIRIDGTIVLGSWREGSVREKQKQVWIEPGRHQVTIEYFELTGWAELQVNWQLL